MYAKQGWRKEIVKNCMVYSHMEQIFHNKLTNSCVKSLFSGASFNKISGRYLNGHILAPGVDPRVCKGVGLIDVTEDSLTPPAET